MRANELKGFLCALWPTLPDNPGDFTVWAKGKGSVHLPLDELIDDNSALTRLLLSVGGHDWYFGLATRRPGLPPKRRGGKADLEWLPALALDIDMADPLAHVATDLPNTLDEAQEILDAGETEPSVIVYTGHGLHCYWVLSEPIPVDNPKSIEKQIKTWFRPYKEYADERGWHLDDCTTVDRVWRLPGSANTKTNPRTVQILEIDENPERLHLSIPTSAEPKNRPKRNVDLPDLSDEAPADLVQRLSQGDSDRAKVWRLIAQGRAPAELGERDVEIQRITGQLVWADGLRTSAEALLGLLRGSLTHWADDDWIAVAREKIQRHQTLLAQSEEGQTMLGGREVDGFVDRRSIAVEQALAQSTTVDTDSDTPAETRLILQHRDLHYVFNLPAGSYQISPVRESQLPAELRDCWPENYRIPTKRWDEKSARMKRIPTPEIRDMYGTNVQEVRHSLLLTKPLHDPRARELLLPAGDRRPLTPRRHAQIERWLDAFCKKPEDTPILLDWIACVTAQDRVCCAIYIHGQKGLGKTLLAGGLAHLWMGPAVEASVAFGRFNAPLLESPLIVLDEAWDGDKSINVSAALRKAIGGTRHRIEAKFQANSTLEGALRLMIMANNTEALAQYDKSATKADRDAVGERVRRIELNPDAAKFVGKAQQEGWRENGLIAEHALWLRDQRLADVIARANATGQRFLVAGDPRDRLFHGSAAGAGYMSATLDWVAWVMQAWAASSGEGGVTSVAGNNLDIGPGKVRLHARAIIDTWSLFPGHEHYRGLRMTWSGFHGALQGFCSDPDPSEEDNLLTLDIEILAGVLRERHNFVVPEIFKK